MTLAERVVVVGVSGGIAAYKACELVRTLRARGATVVVVMTKAATEFVTPLTFQVLSGNPVVHDLWGDQAPRFELPAEALRKMGGKVEHVDVAEASDVVVIAPATADVMARLVHGSAPDALTAVALASRAPLVVCPSMDLQMWQQAVTQENLRTLRARGAIVVGPASGPLASGLDGPGRLAGVEAIVEAIERASVRRRSMAGLRVLVGAGRTEEPIDPVRVLTNRSSGKMGYALAAAARDRGASVTLVSGPTNVDPPFGVDLVPVRTALEMERALASQASASNLIVMAAAVADYRPTQVLRSKIKRGAGRRTLTLDPNPDVIAGLTSRRRRGQVFVGFALETNDGLARAKEKLRAKGLDLVALNAPEDSIGKDTNHLTLVEVHRVERLPVLTKREAAEAVLDRALTIRTAASDGAAPQTAPKPRAARPRSARRAER